MHSPAKLLNDVYPDKFREAAAAKLESRGVKLVLGERILNLPAEGLSSEREAQDAHPVELKTKSGLTLTADLVVRVALHYSDDMG